VEGSKDLSTGDDDGFIGFGDNNNQSAVVGRGESQRAEIIVNMDNRAETGLHQDGKQDEQEEQQEEEEKEGEEGEHEGGWVEEDFISLEKYSRAQGRFEKRTAEAQAEAETAEIGDDVEEGGDQGDDQRGAGAVEDEPFDLDLCPDEEHRSAARAFMDAGLLWLIPRCLLTQANPFGESNTATAPNHSLSH
jgi:hypothetical protein